MSKATVVLRCIVTLALCCAASVSKNSAVAADRCVPRCGCECRPLACCPDDYCRKAFPFLSCLSRCGNIDDYCKKPPPCIKCYDGCGSVDDYCRKPAPCDCRPLCFDVFRCVPTNPSCGPGLSEVPHQPSNAGKSKHPAYSLR